MFKYYFFSILIIAFASCARQSAPTGGPKDFTPPKFLKAYPDTLSKNVSIYTKEIRIDFDEYIVLKDAQKQLVISPPLQHSYGITPSQNSPKKYILISLKDTLQAHATYNFNFGESIQDNTENNKLANFSYIFSTGNSIDSLQLSGKVRRAMNDEVNLKTLIALYKKDTAAIDLNKKPYYITKVDSAGNYKFNYLSKGKYQLLAFTDEDFNTRFDKQKEEFGFISESIDLHSNTTQNLVLAKFTDDYKAVALKQDGQGKLILSTTGKPEKISIIPLEKDFPEKYTIIHNPRTDSTYLWFNSKNIKFEEKNVRWKFAIDNGSKKDTLSVTYNAKTETKLSVSNIQKEMVPNEFVTFKFNNSIEKIDPSQTKVKKDSLELPFKLEINTMDPTELNLKFPVEFNTKYTIQVLPKTVTDFLGQTNDSLTYTFTTKNKNEYGNLHLKINNAPKKPFIFQLIQGTKIVKEWYKKNEVIDIVNLLPGDYSFRILVDENENEIWDTGDFKTQKQPEKTYSSPNIVTIRAFWDINEIWTLSD